MNKKEARLRRAKQTRLRIALQRATRLVDSLYPELGAVDQLGDVLHLATRSAAVA